MSTVTHIYDAIDRLAPFWLTMDFDNTGILVGDRNREVSCALLALDCTPSVIEQAKQLGAQLIVTHHPVIFHPLKRVNEDAVVYQLIRSDIAVISATPTSTSRRAGSTTRWPAPSAYATVGVWNF